jgi:hypothetical protein
MTKELATKDAPVPSAEEIRRRLHRREMIATALIVLGLILALVVTAEFLGKPKPGDEPVPAATHQPLSTP